ncbi:MAG: PDDEXK nuclease domain-containing protein [Coriobacteriales bacterium]|nr:PDDEXK nuclease domain-containing protein [Coriobacteriales bacterium]
MADTDGSNGGQILPQLAADSDFRVGGLESREFFSIPWGHIRLLVDKCKGDRDKALFYVRKTMENGWSRAVLAHQVEANLYERQGKAATNFSRLLPSSQSDLAQEITKDPYQFDFLAIREDYDELELKNALMDNVQRFLLELGTGFAFLGREYRVIVGAREKFIDMLFYHTRLHCYVVLEVKARDFDSSDMGQLGTYVVTVNHLLKSEVDAPTIGLLVCKGLDKVEAQYALEASSQPIGISGYELSKLIPEEYKGSLPTIEEIESELEG